MCGVEMVISHGKIKTIKGEKQHPFSKGHICPKAAPLGDIHQDPNRLKTPVMGKGDQWITITWEEAFEMTTPHLGTIREDHDNNAFGVYLGNPSVHNYGILTHGPQLLKVLKTNNRFSASSVDQWPHQMVAWAMY